MTPRGRWAKWYATVALTKISYTDAQFRAFAILVALGSECDGEWKSRAALAEQLDHLIDSASGTDLVAFLITQGDLKVRRGGRVEMAGWAIYQGAKPDTTAAARKRAERARRSANVTQPVTPFAKDAQSETSIDVPSEHESHSVTKRDPLLLSSPLGTPSSVEVPSRAPAKAPPGYPDSDDRDALDTYHELTGWRPWSAFSGTKLRAAIRDYGNEQVDAALRKAASHDAERTTLLDRTLAHLARDTERAKIEAEAKRPAIRVATEDEKEAARAKARAIEAEVLGPEKIAEGMAAWESLRRPRPTGGAPAKVGTLFTDTKEARPS